MSLSDSWTNMTVRYLVPARERRKWSSTLFIEIGAAIADPRHGERIVAAYPVRRVELPPAQGGGKAEDARQP